jgi:hypothetical protein
MIRLRRGEFQHGADVVRFEIKSARISCSLTPAANRSSTSLTRTRSLRMHVRPPHCVGFSVIRSSRLMTMRLYYAPTVVGMMKLDDRERELRGVSLSGERLSFVIDDMRYCCRADGDSIRGEARGRFQCRARRMEANGRDLNSASSALCLAAPLAGRESGGAQITPDRHQ